MIKLNELKVSYHFQNDRKERKERIDAIINGNFGQVVIEQYFKDAWRVLTDTGIMAVVTPNKELILTYYFCPMETARMIYKSQGKKMPDYIANKIKKNARTYKNIYEENFHKGIDNSPCQCYN